MVEPSIPLTAISEDQRAQAHTRYSHSTGPGRRSLSGTGCTYLPHLKEHHWAMGQITKGNVRLIERLMIQVEHI